MQSSSDILLVDILSSCLVQKPVIFGNLKDTLPGMNLSEVQHD